MSDELFQILFNYIYVPFVAAFILSASFFWRLREKDCENMLNEIEEIDKRLSNAVSHAEVRLMIEDKFEQLNRSNDVQTKLLSKITENTAQTSVNIARMDERLKAVESKISS